MSKLMLLMCAQAQALKQGIVIRFAKMILAILSMVSVPLRILSVLISVCVVAFTANATDATDSQIASVSDSVSDSISTTKSGYLYSDYLQNPELYGTQTAGSFVLSSPQSPPEQFFNQSYTRIGKIIQNRWDNAPVRRQILDALLDDNANPAQEWQEWLGTSAWQSGEIILQEALDAATADWQRSGFIRNIGVEVQSELGRRFQQAGINILGAFHASERDALVWQLRGYKGRDDDDDVDGGNAGLIYRRSAGTAMLGANVFLDVQQQQIAKTQRGGEAVSFWRWGGGGEFRSAWLDVFGNYYDAFTTPYVRTVTVNNGLVRRHFYSASGYDAEVNLHSPDYPWLILAASYYTWRSEDFSETDDRGARYGVKFAPRQYPVVLEVEYQSHGEGEQKLGGSFAFNHEFGRDNANGDLIEKAQFRPQDYFFLPVQREYSQRIRYSDSANLDRAFWVIGQRDVVRGEARIIRDSTLRQTATITLRTNAVSTVSVSLPMVADEVMSVVATGRATMHYNVQYAVSGQDLQLRGLGTAAVSGTIEAKYIEGDEGIASVLQHLRVVGAGEMMLMGGRETGFAAITPDMTLRIIAPNTTVSVKYLPPSAQGTPGTVYMTLYSGGVSVQTETGGISHLCEGSRGINQLSRDGITLQIECQFDSTNHVRLADVQTYNTQSPITLITLVGNIVNRERMVSLSQPAQRGSTPTVSFLLRHDNALSYLSTQSIAQITYAGSGFRYRSIGGTRGLRINDDGHIFINSNINVNAEPFSQTLNLFFEVYSPNNPNVQTRTGSWQMILNGNPYGGDIDIGSGKANSLFTVLMALQQNGEVQQTAVAADLAASGGTGDYLLAIQSGDNSNHFADADNRGDVEVRRVVPDTSPNAAANARSTLTSDVSLTLTVVANDRGYLSHLSQPATTIITVRYLEPLRNAELIFMEDDGQAIYGGLTPVRVYNGIGEVVNLQVPGYEVTPLRDGQHRLEYLLYDGINGVAVVPSLASNSPIGYVQYEGGSSLAILASKVSGRYNLELRQSQTNPRRWGLHFTLDPVNARPLTSTVAVNVSIEVTLTDQTIPNKVAFSTTLQVAGKYQQVETRLASQLRASVSNANSGFFAYDTYKHNFAGGVLSSPVNINNVPVTIRALTDIDLAIATITANGGSGFYGYRIADSSASGNSYVTLGGVAGNVLYYHSEPPTGVLRFEVEARDERITQLGIRNFVQVTLATVTFYVQNRSPQPTSLSLTIIPPSPQSAPNSLNECLNASPTNAQTSCNPLVVANAPDYVAVVDNTILAVQDNLRNAQTVSRIIASDGSSNNISIVLRRAQNLDATHANLRNNHVPPNARNFALIASDQSNGANLFPAGRVQTVDILAVTWQQGVSGDGEALLGNSLTATVGAAQKILLMSRDISVSVVANPSWHGVVARATENGEQVIIATLENNAQLAAEQLLAARLDAYGGVGGADLGSYHYSIMEVNEGSGPTNIFSIEESSGELRYGARSAAGIYTLGIVVTDRDADTSGSNFSRLTRDLTLTVRVRLVQESLLFANNISGLVLWRAGDNLSNTNINNGQMIVMNNYYENHRVPTDCERTIGCEWTFIGNVQARHSNGVIPEDILTWRASQGLLLRPITITNGGNIIAVQELWMTAQTRFDNFGNLLGDDAFNIEVSYKGRNASAVSFQVRGGGEVKRIRLPENAVNFIPSQVFMSASVYNNAQGRVSVGSVTWPDLSALDVVNNAYTSQVQHARIECNASVEVNEFCAALSFDNNILYLQKDRFAPDLLPRALTIQASVILTRNGIERTFPVQFIIDGNGSDNGDFVLAASLADSPDDVQILMSNDSAQTVSVVSLRSTNAPTAYNIPNQVSIEVQAPFVDILLSSSGDWIDVATLSLSGGQPPYRARLLAVNDPYARGEVIGLANNGGNANQNPNAISSIRESGNMAVLRVALPAPNYAPRTAAPAELLRYDFVVEDANGRQHRLQVRASDTLRAQLSPIPLVLDAASRLDATYSGSGTSASPLIVPSLFEVPVFLAELQLPPATGDYRVWAGASGRALGAVSGPLGQLQISQGSDNLSTALYLKLPRNGERLRQWHEYIIQHIPSGAMRRQTVYVAPVAPRPVTYTRDIQTNTPAYLGGTGSSTSPYRIAANAGWVTVGRVEVAVPSKLTLTSVYDYLSARKLPLSADNSSTFAGEAVSLDAQTFALRVPSLSPGQVVRLGVMNYRTQSSNGNDYPIEYAYAHSNDIYITVGGDITADSKLYVPLRGSSAGQRRFAATALVTLTDSVTYQGCGANNGDGCLAFSSDVGGSGSAVRIIEESGSYVISLTEIDAGAGGSFQASLLFAGDTPANNVILEIGGIVPLMLDNVPQRVYRFNDTRPVQIAQLRLPTVGGEYSIVPQSSYSMDSAGQVYASDVSGLPLGTNGGDNGQHVLSVVMRDGLWYTPHTLYTLTTYVYREGSPINPFDVDITESFALSEVNDVLENRESHAVDIAISGGVGYIPQHYQVGISGPSYIALSTLREIVLTNNARARGDLSGLFYHAITTATGNSQSPPTQLVVPSTLNIADSRYGLPTADNAYNEPYEIDVTIAAPTALSNGSAPALNFVRGDDNVTITFNAALNDSSIINDGGNRISPIEFTVNSDVWLASDAAMDASAEFILSQKLATDTRRVYEVVSRRQRGDSQPLPANGTYMVSVNSVIGLQTAAVEFTISVDSVQLAAGLYTEDTGDLVTGEQRITVYFPEINSTYTDLRLGVNGGRDVYANHYVISDSVQYNGNNYNLKSPSLPVFLQQFHLAAVGQQTIYTNAANPYRFLGEWRAEAGQAPAYGQHTLVLSGIGSQTDVASGSAVNFTLTMDIERGADPAAQPVVRLNSNNSTLYLDDVESNLLNIIPNNVYDSATGRRPVQVGNAFSYFYTRGAEIVSVEMIPHSPTEPRDTFSSMLSSPPASLGLPGSGVATLVMRYTISVGGANNGGIFITNAYAARSANTVDINLRSFRDNLSAVNAELISLSVFYRAGGGFNSQIQSKVVPFNLSYARSRSALPVLEASPPSPLPADYSLTEEFSNAPITFDLGPNRERNLKARPSADIPSSWVWVGNYLENFLGAMSQKSGRTIPITHEHLARVRKVASRDSSVGAQVITTTLNHNVYHITVDDDGSKGNIYITDIHRVVNGVSVRQTFADLDNDLGSATNYGMMEDYQIRMSFDGTNYSDVEFNFTLAK